MQTLPSGIKKVEATDNATVASINRNDDLLDAKINELNGITATVTAHLSDYVRQPGYAITAGPANAYTVTTTPAPTAYVDGMGLVIRVHAANTDASTVKWGSLAAVPIVDSKGQPLTAGKLPLGGRVSLRYSAASANFQLLGEGGGLDDEELQALIDIANEADANNDVIKSDVINKLNVAIGTSLTSSATWAKIRAAIIKDADLISANVKAGVNVYGLTGSYEGEGVIGQSLNSVEYAEAINANDPVFTMRGMPVKLAVEPAELTTKNVMGVSWSADGVYMAAALNESPFLAIYKRDGDTLTKLADPATMPASAGVSIAFSPNGVYLAVGVYSSGMFLYRRDGDTFTKLANPSTQVTRAEGLSWSHDSLYLAAGSGASTPSLVIYKRNSDAFTKLADPSFVPAGAVKTLSFSPDGYLVLGLGTLPRLVIYKQNGDTFTKLADGNISGIISADVSNVCFSPNGRYIVVNFSISNGTVIFKRNGDLFSTIAMMPIQYFNRSFYSPDGVYIVCANQGGTPYISLYRQDGDGISQLGSPAITASSAMYAAGFTPDGNYLAVAGSTGGNGSFKLYRHKEKAYKYDAIGEWRGVTEKLGYAKESGIAGEVKTIAITHG